MTTAVAKRKASAVSIEALLTHDRDLMKALLKESLHEVLEAEMAGALGTLPGGRTETRLSYRLGYCQRNLLTRVGKPELKVPGTAAARSRQPC